MRGSRPLIVAGLLALGALLGADATRATAQVVVGGGGWGGGFGRGWGVSVGGGRWAGGPGWGGPGWGGPGWGGPGWGPGWGGPVAVARPAVIAPYGYYAAPPVIVRPAPVFVQPAPVIVRPPIVASPYYGPYGW
jgi:hypothetical protein